MDRTPSGFAATGAEYRPAYAEYVVKLLYDTVY